ncbi:MAG: SusE domain-containing protein [Bacteroidales bacterium]
MKKIILIFTMALGIGLFFSGCEKNDKEPKLNIEKTVASAITTPASGTAIVLTLADSANPFVVQWNETTYSTTEDAVLPAPTYSLQMVFSGSSFESSKELFNTQDLKFETIYYKLNNSLISMGMAADSTGEIDIRVLAQISGAEDTQVASEIITLTVTTFEPPVPPPTDTKLIYLLGEATTVGWDNANALPMAHLEEARYARVAYLDPAAGNFYKFISVLGAWAPQWGTDATGTPEEGPLVYRPDEATPDPDALPVPLVAGDYYIEADTVGLTYKTFLTSGELYLAGAATTVADNTAGLPFYRS